MSDLVIVPEKKGIVEVIQDLGLPELSKLFEPENFNDFGEAVIPFDLTANFWSFDEGEIQKGDSKHLIFLGVEVLTFEDDDENPERTVGVNFIERLVDEGTGEITYQVVTITATKVRNYFADKFAWQNDGEALIKESALVNVGWSYRIQYKNHKKRKKGKGKWADMSISPIIFKPQTS